MKRSFYLFLPIVALSIFGISSMSLAAPHEAKPKPSATVAIKITKEEAKRAVLFANTGSAIEGCEMVQGKDHPNWAVSVVKAGTATAVKVEVDGMTGKILNATSAGSTKPPM